MLKCDSYFCSKKPKSTKLKWNKCFYGHPLISAENFEKCLRLEKHNDLLIGLLAKTAANPSRG